MSASQKAHDAPRGDSILSSRTKQAGRALLSPIVRLALALHITANMVTVFGLFIVVVATVLVATGNLLIGALVLGFGSALDAVDGSLARASGGTTKFGAFFDSTLDRAAEAILYSGVAVYFLRTSDDPTIPVLLAMVALTGSFLVSYSRARAEGIGISAEVGLAPRVERLVLIVLGIGLAGFGVDWALVGALAIIAALAVTTTVQRIWHVYRLTSGAPQGATTTTRTKESEQGG
jgi:CDP-diacylglycerol--glycerol-3-phosphate 3-phosphatidyltransferase